MSQLRSIYRLHPQMPRLTCLGGLVDRSITGENLIAEIPRLPSGQGSILQLHPPGDDQEELPFSVIGKLLRAARAFMVNPVEVALYVPERINARHEYPASYQPDPDWEVRLHSWLGAAWPCPERGMVDTLLHDIASELQTQGLRLGRRTYGEYSDAEVSMARAAWCTALHQRPSVVVETGVARGVTSRIVLEALNRNERGHLWSIDLPHLLEKDLHAQIGAAVPSSHRTRWSYVEGSSRRRLPSLLRSLAQVDLFIHDSVHTARNTRFEMEQILRVLAGIMIVDDISSHQAFADFVRDFPRLETLVCPHSDRAESFFGLVYKPT